MQKSLQGFQHPLAELSASPWRRAAARALRLASFGLARWARKLALRRAAQRGASRPPELEFYAEAGAPEGALYLDGELVGHLPGVSRL